MGEQTKNDFSRFDAMTTEELKMFLRGYLDAPEIEEDGAEMEAVLYIMEVVERRENENKSNTEKTEEVWRDFTENYLPGAGSPEKNNRKQIQPEARDDPHARKPHSRRRFTVLARVACVALVILAVGLAGVGVARASGYDLFGAVGTWTDEIFTFRGRSGKLTLDVPCDSPDGAKYSSLQETLDAYDVTLPLAPTWIPPEYSLTDVYADYIPGHLLIHASYELDDAEIYMNIRTVADGSFGWVQKDDGDALEYTSNGISHYMMTNRSETLAVWLNEEYECLIAGTDVSFKQLQTIIDSVYDKDGRVHTAYESERSGRLTMDVPSDVPEGEVVYTSLQEALDAYDVTVPLAPTWIPKEYGFSGVSATKILEESYFFANYVSAGGKEITESIQVLKNPSFGHVEKDAGDVEIYETGGINHYIMTNLRYTQASWLNENCECVLAGSSLSVKQLKQIIDSIYGRN